MYKFYVDMYKYSANCICILYTMLFYDNHCFKLLLFMLKESLNEVVTLFSMYPVAQSSKLMPFLEFQVATVLNFYDIIVLNAPL